MKAHVRKLAGGVFVPDTDLDSSAMEGLKTGAVISIEWKRPRNYKFHKKMFALLKVAFDAWEPTTATYKGQIVGKNFEQFRNDVVCLCGHYEMAINLRGETRVTAKSLSFASMDQDEFDTLYNSMINVILAKILTNYTRDDLDSVVEQILQF